MFSRTRSILIVSQRIAAIPMVVLALSVMIVPMGICQQPPGIKWQKIDTPHFEVIFPEEIAHEGQRVANMMEHLYGPVGMTLGTDMKRTSVLLTNRGVILNTYVLLEPRRSEWSSPPPQSIKVKVGPGELYSLFAAHEGRHIAQFDKMNQGLIRAAWILFGENGQFILSHGISIPLWFWEGDAVGMETALSRTGRGRWRAFDMEIRTLLLSGKRYSYYKANFLSYRDWYPNLYRLGYLLTTHIRREYGTDAWSRIFDDASGFSLYTPFFAFSRALKNHTGKWVAGVYEETMDELEILWREQLSGLDFTNARTLNAQKKIWTDYVLPQYMPDGSVVAARYSMAEPLELVRISPDGEESRIKQFSWHDNTVSVNGGKIAWDEIRFDPRWTARSYSVIVVHYPETGKTKQITDKTRFYAPALSPDGKQIAVVEFTPERMCSLVILDAESGHEVRRFPSDGNEFIRRPSWSSDGNQIVFTRQKTEGVAIAIMDAETGQMHDAIPHTWEDVYNPVIHGNYLFYNSSYSGIDNIYAMELSTDRRYQVTSRKFGAFNPNISPDGSKLVFQDYTVKGHDIAEMPLKPSTWKPIEEVEDRSIRYYEPLVAQEQGKSILDEGMIPDVTYEVKDYNSFANLLNFHSWFVLPAVPFGRVGVISNNKLDTTSLSANVDYNTNERTVRGNLDLSYTGFFPIVDVGISYGRRASTRDTDDDAEERISWNEFSTGLGLRVPLTLSSGTYNSSLELGVRAEYTYISDKTYVDEFHHGDGVLLPLTYGFSYSRVRHASMRDVLPRWAQTAQVLYSHTPGNMDYDGSMLSADVRLFFPGIFKHHSLRIAGAYERQEPDNYRFESEILFPRGYDYRYHDNIYKIAVDYAFPLVYPDFDLGSFLYLKRVKGKLFYDGGIGRDNSDNTVYNSIGVELSADFYLFSLSKPLELSATYSYRFRDNEHRVGPIGFISF